MKKGNDGLAITFKIYEDEGFAMFGFNGVPSLSDYQSALAEVLMQAKAASVDRWLLLLNNGDMEFDDDLRAFDEYVAFDFNKHISSMAVVCPVDQNARVKDSLEPIINSGKPVSMFQTIDEAREWLCKQE